MVDLFFGNKYVIIAKNSLFFAIYGVFSDKYHLTPIFSDEMVYFFTLSDIVPWALCCIV